MRPGRLGKLIETRDSASFITDETAGATVDELLNDRHMRQLVERNAIIGEAVNRLRRRDPDIADKMAPRQITGMRNALAHGHDVIDDETVWGAIHAPLPILRPEIEALRPEKTREQSASTGQ